MEFESIVAGIVINGMYCEYFGICYRLELESIVVRSVIARLGCEKILEPIRVYFQLEFGSIVRWIIIMRVCYENILCPIRR